MGNGFISIGDADIPLNPKEQITKVFTAIDHSIAFGYSNTNWQLLSKTLPLTLFSAVTNNHEVVLRLYLAFLSLIVMLGMYSLMSELVTSKIVSVFISLLWSLQSQVFFWIVFNPNIVMTYSALPISLGGIIGIWKNPQSKSNYLKLITGSILLISADISYAFVSMLGLLIFSIILFLKGNFSIIKISSIFIKIILSIILFSQIITSGLFSNQLFGNSSMIVNTTYTQGAIYSSAKRANVIETLRLGLGTGNYFRELNNNISRIFLNPIIRKISVTSAICVLALGIFSIPQNWIVLPALAISGVGVFLSAGSNLPNWIGFYEWLYTIPGFVLVRNMIKFNLLYQIGFFVIFGIIIQQIVLLKWKSKSIIIIKLILIILISIAPILSVTPYAFKDLGGILKFDQFPNEYYELKNRLQDDSNFRVFFYPLKNPVAPESYKWGNHVGISTPHIINLLGMSNNLVVHPDQHSLSIDLMDILLKTGESNSADVFIERIGMLGYKYVIFRNDVLEKPGDNATADGEKASKLLISKGHLPILKNSIFTVFETPNEVLVPIEWAVNDKIVNFRSPYSFEVELSPNNKKHIIAISELNTHLWFASKPLFPSDLGRKLNSLDPVLFGLPVQIEYLQQSVCQPNSKLEGYYNIYKIGNCLEIVSKYDNNRIVIGYWPNWVTTHLKIFGLAGGIIVWNSLNKKPKVNLKKSIEK